MSRISRSEQKEQTKELILETAYEIFSANGFLNTRMSDIAQAAKVSHGTVFLHFKSQEALITAVVERYAGEVAERTHELSDSCADLKELLVAHLACIEEYEPFYRRLVTEVSRLPQGAKDAWLSLQSAISFHFNRAAEREAAAGTLRKVNGAFLFNLWSGLVHYYLANAELFAPDGQVIRTCGEFMIENFMQLLEK